MRTQVMKLWAPEAPAGENPVSHAEVLRRSLRCTVVSVQAVLAAMVLAGLLAALLIALLSSIARPLGATEIVDTMVARMNDHAALPAARNEACAQLALAEAIPALEEAVADEVVRPCAAGQLRRLGDYAALLRIAQRGAPGARAQALYELGEMKRPEALDTLAPAAKDSDPLVSAGGLNALLQFDDARVLPAVLEIASRQGVSSLIAVNSLGRFHAPTVLPVLYTLLSSRDPLLRVAAIGALGEVGNRESIAKLQPVLGEGNDLRPAASIGIGLFPPVNMARAARVAIDRIRTREDAHAAR